MPAQITLRTILVLALLSPFWSDLAKPVVGAEPSQGMYFAKKKYVPKPLPKYAETRNHLPGPIFDENPLYVSMYWKTWELAFL